MYRCDSINLRVLSQQMLEIVWSEADPTQVLSHLCALIAETLQVEGCTIALPASSPWGAHIAAWRKNVLAGAASCNLEAIVGNPRLTSEVLVVRDVNAPILERCQACEIAELKTLWQSLFPPTTEPGSWHALMATTFQLPQQSPPQANASQANISEASISQESDGVLSVIRSRPHAWTSSEIENFRTVAQQVALALSQLQAQRLNRQLRYQTVVHQLTRALRNSSDLNEILALATEGVAQALQVDRALLLRLKYWEPLFRNRRQEQIPKARITTVCEWEQASSLPSVPQAAVLDASGATASASFWLSECALCQQAFMQPAHLVTFADYPHQPSATATAGVASLFRFDAMTSLLLAPLESQGTVLGFLVFQHSQAHRWQPEELELVELVSAQVSTAIIQTEALRQVQALVEKRTAELSESLSVQAKLYERTRQQLEQLRHLNQLKDEFVNAISHELRTPLTSMTIAIRMLRQVTLDDSANGSSFAARSTRYLDILEQQCAQEINLINDLLALQELETKQVPIQLQEINLHTLVAELTEAFQQRWNAKGLTLAVDLPEAPLKMQSDRGNLARILVELLTNAGKYSDPNSHVQIQVQAQADSTVRFAVINTGVGISADHLPYIFDKFRRCPSAIQNAVQGTGLGLALVKCLVQHLNGTITATSTQLQETDQTCFTLTLPKCLDLTKL